MDLLSVLPDFSTKPYAHILPPLERSRISTVDLITLDSLEIAKRAHVPPADVRRLSARIIKALHHDVGFEEERASVDEAAEPNSSSSVNVDAPVNPGPANKLDLLRWSAISTLDPTLDALLDGGGIPTGYVTEVTGESGSGKTQFLLTLLLAVQLPPPNGLGKTAIYISTEAPLSTTRLSQLLDCHPHLSALPRDQAPSLQNILSISAMDLETQDHILNYQLPVAIKRYNVGLVVIDSITSNYRAEHTSTNVLGLSTRSWELAKLGQLLRNLAVKEDIAIVTANQVSDRIEGEGGGPLLRIASGNAPPFTSSPSTSTQHQQHLHPPPSSNRDVLNPSPRPRPQESGNIELSQHNMVFPSSSPAFPSSPFPAEDDPQQQQQPFDGSYIVRNPVRNEILSLTHQQRFFTGWGDTPYSMAPSFYHRPAQKTPALGLVWLTQVACRIALKKEEQPVAWPDDYHNYNVPASSSVNIQAHEATNHPEGGGKREPETDHPPTTANNISTEERQVETETGNGSEKAEGVKDTDTLPIQPARNMQMAPSSQPQAHLPDRPVRRTMKIVFAPWTGGSTQEPGQEQGRDNEAEFTIWKGGIKSCGG